MTAHLSGKPNRHKVWQFQNGCQPDTTGQGPYSHGPTWTDTRQLHTCPTNRKEIRSGRFRTDVNQTQLARDHLHMVVKTKFWGQQVMLWGQAETFWGQTRGKNKYFGVNKSCCGVQQQRPGVKQGKGTNVLGSTGHALGSNRNVLGSKKTK